MGESLLRTFSRLSFRLILFCSSFVLNVELLKLICSFPLPSRCLADSGSVHIILFSIDLLRSQPETVLETSRWMRSLQHIFSLTAVDLIRCSMLQRSIVFSWISLLNENRLSETPSWRSLPAGQAGRDDEEGGQIARLLGAFFPSTSLTLPSKISSF